MGILTIGGSRVGGRATTAFCPPAIRRACAVAGLVLVALAVAAILPPATIAAGSRFAIDDGRVYTRSLRVGVGDGGWSPFFEPGVVVWDGGSIIAGRAAGESLCVPAQTLRLVSRPCTSYVSVDGYATIAEMIADAPTEVDARYVADGDLNLCLVLAGGGDFYHGATANEVYDGVRAYCAARRAAGFAVVVLTVLPRSSPVTFEESRLAYNELLRASWASFADGLADIAADDRIGDRSDNLDRRYYRADGMHPNAAGNAVMAAVTAPVINALAWRSATCTMRIREAGGEWSAWRPYASLCTWWLTPGEGERTIEAEYADGHGSTASISDSIQVDTVPPAAFALRDARARTGRTARLSYVVTDEQPCGPTATVVLRMLRRDGKVLRTIVRRAQPVGVALTTTFRCSLRRGRYRYDVSARDTAGNRQVEADSARLTVR